MRRDDLDVLEGSEDFDEGRGNLGKIYMYAKGIGL